MPRIPQWRLWAASATLVVIAGALLIQRSRLEADPLRWIKAAWKASGHRPIDGRLRGMPYAPRAASLTDRVDDAVQALEGCTRAEPANAGCWSDLAAADLESARTHDDARAAVRALAAADRALLIAPRFAEALFNRATALEALKLARPGALAWKRYLQVDRDSAWSAEALQRMRRLRAPTRVQLWDDALPRLERAVERNDAATVRAIVAAFPQEARTWGERVFLSQWGEALHDGDGVCAADRLSMARQIGAALIEVNGERLLSEAVQAIDKLPHAAALPLAEAHIVYGRARDLYADRKPTAALRLFEQCAAAFRRGGSPMAGVAEYYRASCRCDMGEIAPSLEIIDAQLAGAPPGYAALRAQLLWERGTASARNGAFFDALKAYGDALALFERLGEGFNADYMRSALCLMQTNTGRDAESWRLRRQSFDSVSKGGHPRVLQVALTAAARSEALAGRWDTARSLYELSLEPELAPPNAVVRADASIWGTLAAHRLGLPDQAGLPRARAAVAQIEDAPLRLSAANRLRIVESLVVRDTHPNRAAELLTESIADAQARKDRFFLPEAYLERGRVWRALGRDDDAIADLTAALELVEQREHTATADELRDSYFQTFDTAAEELVDLLDRHGQRERAFTVADRTRTRLFGSSAQLAPDALTRIPAGTVVVHYTVLAGRVIVFVAGAGGLDAVRIAVPRERLRATIAALNAAIAHGDDSASLQAGRALYDALAAPLRKHIASANALVVVPDATVSAAPFAALRSESGQYLIETKTIVYAPSASVFLQSLARPAASASDGVLAVGNPAFDRGAFPTLPLLPAAEEEARDVARAQPSAMVVTGGAATKDRVVEAMRSSRLIDIGCHAIVDSRDPSRSALLLAAAPNDSGALHLRQVAALRLPSPLVILSGCRTAAIVEGAPPALRSFALAFLTAGSRTVIGALWDVEDEAAGAMSRSLHENLRAGAPPAAALRAAQLSMLRSADAKLRAPSAWSGFQLYGSGW